MGVLTKDRVKETMQFQNRTTITYHRNPTKYEIKFGEGAIHYKEFTLDECWNDKKDDFKRWLICPVDGLRYYY
jgi:hypothetical protein